MSSPTITILGCGWLGMPLAELFVKEGYRVHGSTTSQHKLQGLNNLGIEPFLVDLADPPEEDVMAQFLDSDTLVLNIPPRRSDPEGPDRFLSQMQSLIPVIDRSPVNFVVFASSISVYGTSSGVVTEADAGGDVTNSGRALLQTEELLLVNRGFASTIVRFGGSYGYERQPGRFLAGRQALRNGEAPVNLIHRDDSIGIIYQIVRDDVRHEVFNAVSDEHPSRRDFYTWAADKSGLEEPEFDGAVSAGTKIVSNARLKKVLGYRFLYPSPYDRAP